MNQTKRFIVTFMGVYMHKLLSGKEERKYVMITKDYFAKNIQFANTWAEQSIIGVLPQGIKWLATQCHVVEDNFELLRKGVKVPKNKLRTFLKENFERYSKLIEHGFPGGFRSEEERLKKQSKFLLDLFAKEYRITPRCAKEYTEVFWTKLQNFIITFLRTKDQAVASTQSSQQPELVVGGEESASAG